LATKVKNKTPVSSVTMQGPAIYRITVRGTLDSGWSTRLAGMSITQRQSGDGGQETILVGRLSDQAALSSILIALYDLHLPVLSAECLESG
jgi:hypothetical protein